MKLRLLTIKFIN